MFENFIFHFFFPPMIPGGGILQRKMNFRLIRCPWGYTKIFFGCFKISFLTHGRKLGRGRERETDRRVHIHTHWDPGTNKTNLPGARLSMKKPNQPTSLQSLVWEKETPDFFKHRAENLLAWAARPLSSILQNLLLKMMTTKPTIT